MVKLLIGIAAVASLFLLPQEPEPKPASDGALQALAWLAGEWRGKAGETDVVSWHSDPAGGMIVMATKEIEDGKVSLFDFGVVSERNGHVGFVPYPYGKASVAFLLEDFDPARERALFANREHDFPKSFLFERKGDDALAIVLEGDEGGQHSKVEYALSRVRPED